MTFDPPPKQRLFGLNLMHLSAKNENVGSMLATVASEMLTRLMEFDVW